MRKALLLATAVVFAGTSFAWAAPAPLAPAGKTVLSVTADDLTLVRKKRKKARAGRVATGNAPTVAPSGSPRIDQSLQQRGGASGGSGAAGAGGGSGAAGAGGGSGAGGAGGGSGTGGSGGAGGASR